MYKLNGETKGVARAIACLYLKPQKITTKAVTVPKRVQDRQRDRPYMDIKLRRLVLAVDSIHGPSMHIVNNST